MNAHRSKRIAALLATGALVLAACGDDDDDASAPEPTAEQADTESTSSATESSATESSATETEAPSTTGSSSATESTAASEPAAGEPIKIMTSGPVESPVFSVPSIPIGPQIAVEEINAAGGVNGRPLELIVCNDEADPNKATACVQQAMDEGVVAFVGGMNIFATNILPLTAGDDLAWVGLSTASAFESPNLFNIAGDGATNFAGAGAAAVQSGCTKVATITSVAATPLNGPSLKAGVEAFGGEVVMELQGNGGDFAPMVESAISAGAECIASGVSPGETAGLFGAVAGRLPYFTLDGSLPAGLLAGLGDAADGVGIVTAYLPPNSGNAKVDELLAKSQAIAPEVSLDQFWFSGYAGTHLVAAVLEGVEDVTPSAVMEGLRGVADYDTGLGPVVDFTANVGVPGLESIYNTNLYLLTAQGGAYELAQDEPIDMLPALQLLAS